jgi:hypothetical protein
MFAVALITAQDSAMRGHGQCPCPIYMSSVTNQTDAWQP